MHTGDDEGGTFFDDEQDPLAFLQGMETSDKAPYELLRRRNRRRSSRRLRQLAEEEEDQGGEDQEDQEEEEDAEGDAMDEDEGEGVDHQTAAERDLNLDLTAGPSTAAAAAAAGDFAEEEEDLGLNSDGEEGIRDEWNEALAERFGLAPPTRRKVKNREKNRRAGRRHRDLPEHVSRKLGEANILYATQKHQEAIVLLQEVVRLAPNATDAYHLLGLLYEEIGDVKRSLNFFMIAAHLTPKQVDLWRRLADMSSKQGLVRQAVYCLTQVTKRDRDDVDARFDCALLLSSLGQRRKAIEGLETVRAARPEHPEVAKQLARIYFHSAQHDKAADVLKSYWEAYPETTDLTHVNLLAELLCTPEVGAWQEALDVLAKARETLLEGSEVMPVELEVKAALATARLGDIDAAEQQLQLLFGHEVAAFDDLYFSAADTFEALGRDEKAEPFLRSLADDPQTSRFDVWRRLAECRKRLQGPGAAVEIWRELIESMNPSEGSFMDAMMALADALRAAGDEAGALQALGKLGGEIPVGALAGSEAVKSETDLLQKTAVLKACGREDLMLSLALPSLQATLGALAVSDPVMDSRTNRGKARERSRKRVSRRRQQEEDDAATAAAGGGGGGGGGDAVFVGYVADQRRRNKRWAAAAAARGESARGDGDGGDHTTANNNNNISNAPPSFAFESGATHGGLLFAAPVLPGLLKADETFQLLVDTSLSLIDSGRVSEARHVSELAVDVLGRKSPNRRKRDTMRLIAGKSALAQGDLHAALRWLKSPATRWNGSPAVWNVFSQVQAAAGGSRQTIKFLAPLRARNPASLPLALMLGHAHLQAGAYASALGEYFQAYRFAPDEPLVLLSIAVALVNQAASKHVPDRHAAVLQAFGFLQEYGRRRRDVVEAAFNIGRAAQHLSLNFLAVPMYEKAIAAWSGGGGGAQNRNAVVVVDGEDKEDDDEDVMMVVDTPAAVDALAAPISKESDEEGAAAAVGQQFLVGPEAAFNLSLVLKASGAPELARQVLRDHLTF